MCRSTAECRFAMTCVPHTCLSPSLLERIPVTSLAPQTPCYLLVAFWTASQLAGPSPRDPTSVSVASGLGWAIELWRDRQDSRTIPACLLWPGGSPLAAQPCSAGNRWDALTDKGWGVDRSCVKQEMRGEGVISEPGGLFKQIKCSKKGNRFWAWNKHRTKTYPIDWLTSRGAKHKKTERWGQRKSGCEDRALSTRGASWGSSKRLFLPPASHSTGPCVSARSCRICKWKG